MTTYKRKTAREEWALTPSPRSKAMTTKDQAIVQNLRETVSTVLEGWTLPDAVRKQLETAYWAEQQPAKPLTDAFAKAASEHGLTLVITVDGYKLMKCGPATAHGVKP